MPRVNHRAWTHEYQKAWQEFFDEGPKMTDEILNHLEYLRGTGKFR
ncbi:MAG: hypothetical protein SFX74_05065 [Fimbriimonadaceae bacterium]|nr:hypothetical protein [Fimbriimonadaceae bacterium]